MIRTETETRHITGFCLPSIIQKLLQAGGRSNFGSGSAFVTNIYTSPKSYIEFVISGQIKSHVIKLDFRICSNRFIIL